MTNTLLAYHGDHALNRAYEHQAADTLIQGTGWGGHRGCAVGCTLEEYNHALYPDMLGVPVEITLADVVTVFNVGGMKSLEDKNPSIEYGEPTPTLLVPIPLVSIQAIFILHGVPRCRRTQ